MNTNNPLQIANSTIIDHKTGEYVPLTNHPLIEEYFVVMLISVPLLIITCVCFCRYWNFQTSDVRIKKHKDSNNENENKATINVQKKSQNSGQTDSTEVNKQNELIINTMKHERKLRMQSRDNIDIGAEDIMAGNFMAGIKVETRSNSSLGDETGYNQDNKSESKEVQQRMSDGTNIDQAKKFNFGH